MVKIKCLASYLLVVMVLLAACSEQPAKLTNGDPAPAFKLPTLSGSSLGLPQSGKVVAVRFWADWCPFCENEMQAIEPVYQEYRNQGLVILAVNVRQDQDTAQAFMDKLEVTYSALLDGDGAVARRYGVIGLPTTFFIDREGRVAGRILGESTAEVFAQMVEKLL